MNIVKKIALLLTIIGGLNWGLVGVANFNLVTFLFGATALTNIVYILVGLSALVLIFAHTTAKPLK